MDDSVDVGQCLFRGSLVTDVTADKSGARRHSRKLIAVNLRLEGIQHDDFVTRVDEPLHEVGADESAAPGH
jgi:hypothetical protein